MHPAPSLIAFTTLSGLGFGLLLWLGLDATPPTGWTGFAFFLIGFVLAGGGLLSSTQHLGRPERALKAFTQWRSSWLSREAWAASATLVVTGLYAALLVLLGVHVAILGWLSAALCLVTVVCTAMIYAQLRTVPRWHHWSTPTLFAAYALAGGALLSGRVQVALALILIAGALQVWWWIDGDTRLKSSGTTLGTATGLGDRGQVRAFEPPHTGGNYLTKEMVFVVGRKHGDKLRMIAIALTTGVPLLLLILPFSHIFALAAVLVHVAGVVVARWLFFAQAEHVVGLYYGAHQS